jgi:YfiH family protein
MIQKTIDLSDILFFGNLSGYREMRHFISTRTGGVSKPPFNSLNLGFHVGDDPDRVLRNRRALAKSMGIPLNRFTIAKQIHSGNVRIITDEMRGSGSMDQENAVESTDAMVTDRTGICLTILVADCVPMLFFDPVQRAIGVAHAGWKGTLQLIAQKTVMTMETAFGSRAENIMVGIGPSIGPCCYRVGSDVISRIENIFPTAQGLILHQSDDGAGYFDLWKANVDQLIALGIEIKNIELARICTQENTDLFFSYRHQHGDTGRFGAGITLLPS